MSHDATPLPAAPSQEPGGRAVPVQEVRGMCHDLRQPLAAIYLLAEAAARELARDGGRGGHATVQSRLRAVVDQVRWVSQVVDDVLDPPQQARTSAVQDLYQVARRTVGAARPSTTSRLHVTGSPRTFVLVPTVGLQRSLGNLLDNALRAAGPHGRVRVRVGADAVRARVTVEDDGPGLGRLPQGNGLGLLVVRSFLASCDGELGMCRSDLGGAAVTLSLPVLPTAVRPS